MKLTKSHENYITTLMLGVAVCFAFFAVSANSVHAEGEATTDTEKVSTEEDKTKILEMKEQIKKVSTDEDKTKILEMKEQIKKVSTDEDRAKLLEMKKQIEELRAVVEAYRVGLKEKRVEVKEEFKEKRVESKTEFKMTKEEFMALLEGLSEEERRVAMLGFVESLKSFIEARKVGFKEQLEVKKEALETNKSNLKEMRDELRPNLEGLTREQKIEAIMERVATIRIMIQEKQEESPAVEAEVGEGEEAEVEEEPATDEVEE